MPRLILILFLFVFLFTSQGFGLVHSSTKLSGGLVLESGIHYFTDKVGVGFNLTSPHIINQSVALSASYLYHSFRGLSTTNTNTSLWIHYHIARVGVQFLAHQEYRFRPLSEIGWLGKWSNGTNQQLLFVQGMYLDFGFEFFWKQGWSSKITLGADAIMEDTPSVHERIKNEPYYLNGLSIKLVNQFYLP